MNLIRTSLALLITASILPANASGLDTAQSIQQKTNNASAASQKRISASADHSVSMRAEIEQLREEVKNLEVYQQHLTSMVANQEQEQTSLLNQIEEIKVTRQGVVPLMYQMIDGLKENIEKDKPIKLEQRQERVEKLVALMPRANVSDAEKYRRILEAYQIEMDYGTKLGTYQGSIQIDGESREADILYVGRLALVARSLNGTIFWSWQQDQSQWQEIDSAMKSELDTAFSIADKQIAPGLITVPVSLNAVEFD